MCALLSLAGPAVGSGWRSWGFRAPGHLQRILLLRRPPPLTHPWGTRGLPAPLLPPTVPPAADGLSHGRRERGGGPLFQREPVLAAEPLQPAGRQERFRATPG